MKHIFRKLVPKKTGKEQKDYGPFSHAHDFVIQRAEMNEITQDIRIDTQNIYNYPSYEPLSPLRMNMPCASRTFVGQENYLERLREYFRISNTPARKMFLLYGMGGIGKTQICLKFADETAGMFSHVFWIDTTSEDTVALSLKEIYKQLAQPKTPASSFSPAAVLGMISRLGSEWLIIFDNADGSPDLVEKYLPPGNLGNILITSRNAQHRRLTSSKASMEVSEMSNEAAIELILKTSGYDSDSQEYIGDAQLIVNQLNHHPLAIDMAGAYIMQTQCHINEFLDLYNKYRPKILDNEKFQGASAYNKSVYKTWEMSFQAILKISTDMENQEKAAIAKYAMTLINISAFFHYENISYEIFQRAADNHIENAHFTESNSNDIPTYLPTVDHSVFNIDNHQNWNEYLFLESIALLYSYSLINKMQGSKMYSMHPLVQTYCQDRLNMDEKHTWILNARALIASSVYVHDPDEYMVVMFPEFLENLENEDELTMEEKQRRIENYKPFTMGLSSVYEHSAGEYTYQITLLPHLLKNLDNEQHRVKVEYYDDLHIPIATVLHNTGKYSIEEKYRLDIVNEHLAKMVEINHDISGSLTKLEKIYIIGKYSMKWIARLMYALEHVHLVTFCYNSLGKYNEAEKLQIQLLHIMELIYGNHHPVTIGSMFDLSTTKSMLGNWTEAERLQTQVLASSEIIYGKEHPHAISAMNSLADTLAWQGRLNEAEQLQIKVVTLREKIHGKDHPLTMNSINSLASTYSDLGRWDEAEQMQIQALNTSERIYGKEHPKTLNHMNSLAATYSEQGRFSEAEKLMTEVLAMTEKLLGKEHPVTLRRMNQLAAIFSKQKQWDEAEKLQIYALMMNERILGKEHPDTLNSMNDLVAMLCEQGRLDEAEESGVQLLSMMENILGKQHISTVKAMVNLGAIYFKQGRWDEAEQLQTQVLPMMENILGNEHIDTIRSKGYLAATYSKQQKWEEAEKLQPHVLTVMEKVLGDEHPETLSSMSSLAAILFHLGKLAQAEELHIKMLTTKENIFGKDHPDTIFNMVNLGVIYSQQERWAEAEQMRRRVLTLKEKILGKEHPDTISIMSDVAGALFHQGRLDEAEELNTQVLRMREKVLGREHPDTITCMDDLAYLFYDQGRLDEAEQMQLQVLAIRENVLGNEHPDTIAIMQDLAATFMAQGKWNEAQQLEMKIQHIIGGVNERNILILSMSENDE